MAGRRRGRPPHPDVLTPAEWRVLEELRTGATNAEIAVRLGVSVAAVKYHVGNMLAKLELGDRHELSAWRPRAKRGRLRGVLAVPAGLAPLARPLGWVGAGTALAAGVAVVTVALVAMAGEDAPDVIRPSTTVTPATTPPVTVTPTTTPTVTVSPATTPPVTVTPTTTHPATATSEPLATPPSDTVQDDRGLRRIEGLYTPGLLVVTDGSPDSLLLEWSHIYPVEDGGAWQYRARRWVGGSPQEWEPWTDIPGSEGVVCPSSGPEMATCSYRVTGLLPETGYDFGLRSGSGGFSTVSQGGTLWTDSLDGSPRMPGYGAARGDGYTLWWVPPNLRIVIPEGMRLRNETLACIDCSPRFTLLDVDTGSRLRFWSTWGEGAFRLRAFVPPSSAELLVLPQCFPRRMEYSVTVRPDRTRGRDVAALFGQIITAVAPPFPSTCTYEFSPLEYALLPAEVSGSQFVAIPPPD